MRTDVPARAASSYCGFALCRAASGASRGRRLTSAVLHPIRVSRLRSRSRRSRASLRRDVHARQVDPSRHLARIADLAKAARHEVRVVPATLAKQLGVERVHVWSPILGDSVVGEVSHFASRERRHYIRSQSQIWPLASGLWPLCPPCPPCPCVAVLRSRVVVQRSCVPCSGRSSPLSWRLWRLGGSIPAARVSAARR